MEEGLSDSKPLIHMQETKDQQEQKLFQATKGYQRISPDNKGSVHLRNGAQTPVKNVEPLVDDCSYLNQETDPLMRVSTSISNKSTPRSCNSRTMHTEKKQLEEIREEYIHSNFDLDMLINAQPDEEEEICSLNNISS